MPFQTFPIPDERPSVARVDALLQAAREALVPISVRLSTAVDAGVQASEGMVNGVASRLRRSVAAQTAAHGRRVTGVVKGLQTAVSEGVALAGTVVSGPAGKVGIHDSATYYVLVSSDESHGVIVPENARGPWHAQGYRDWWAAVGTGKAQACAAVSGRVDSYYQQLQTPPVWLEALARSDCGWTGYNKWRHMPQAWYVIRLDNGTLTTMSTWDDRWPQVQA